MRQWQQVFRGRRSRAWTRFFERYRGRSLLLHDGLPDDWLNRLLRSPGGAGHLRVDLRHQGQAAGRLPGWAAGPVTILDWVVSAQVGPCALPRPILIAPRGPSGQAAPGSELGRLYLRHLTRGDNAVAPEEVHELLAAIEARYHVRLIVEMTGRTRSEQGLPLDQNPLEFPDLTSDLV